MGGSAQSDCFWRWDEKRPRSNVFEQTGHSPSRTANKGMQAPLESADIVRAHRHRECDQAQLGNAFAVLAMHLEHDLNPVYSPRATNPSRLYNL